MPDPLTAVAISPGGDLVAIGDGTGRIIFLRAHGAGQANNPDP